MHVRSSRVVLTPRCWCPAQCAQARCRAWWPTSPAHQGDREAAVQTVAQGRPGVSGCTCGTCRLHFFEQAGHGRQPTPGLPCALCLEGGDRDQQLGRNASRGREPMPCSVVLPPPHRCHRRRSVRRGPSTSPSPSRRTARPVGPGDDADCWQPCRASIRFHRWQNHPVMVTLQLRGCDARPEPTYPRGLIDPLGNCPWPGLWTWTYGAHLLS